MRLLLYSASRPPAVSTPLFPFPFPLLDPRFSIMTHHLSLSYIRSAVSIGSFRTRYPHARPHHHPGLYLITTRDNCISAS